GLYSSSYCPFRGTRSPLRYALLRLRLTPLLGYVFAIPLPRWLAIPSIWGAAGLTASAGLGGWVEMVLLRRTLYSQIGHTGLEIGFAIKLWSAPTAGAATACL